MNFLNNWTIELSKLPKYTEFSGNFQEHIDKPLAEIILKNRTGVITPLMLESFKKVVKNIKADDISKVSYSQRNGVGRFYPNDDKGIITNSRHIKHTIFSFMDELDLDQNKGHPTIATGVAANNGLELKTIKNYINNFDVIADQIIAFYSPDEEHQLTKQQVKDFFSSALYGGGFKSWVSSIENDDAKSEYTGFKISNYTTHPFMKEYKNDCSLIHKNILENNEELLFLVSRDCREEYENKLSLYSYWFQIIENHALWLAYNFLVKKGIIIKKHCSLEYDGLCIPKPKIEFNSQAVLNELNGHIMAKMLIPITYKWKGYDAEYIHNELIELRNNTVEAEPEPKKDVFIVDNDNDATIHIFNIVKDKLFYIKGQLYFKYNNKSRIAY